MRNRRTAPALFVTGLLVALAAFPAVAEITPTPVKTTSLNEFQGIAAEDAAANLYFAWTQNVAGKPSHYNAYVQVDWGAPVKVNPPRTIGFSGGIDGGSDTATLAYQQRSGDDSDVMLYDVATDTISEPPAGLNNGSWQFRPTISGQWILYGQIGPSGSWKILLFNTVTEERRLLASSSHCCLLPDQVNGNYAVWTKNFLNVYTYDIAGDTTTRVPNPQGKSQYLGSVTPDGTVYLARSGSGCGVHVKIVRYSSGTATVLAFLADGRDVGSTFASTVGGSTTVYFSRWNCRTEAEDILALPAADTATGSRAPIGPGAGSATVPGQAHPLPEGAVPPG